MTFQIESDKKKEEQAPKPRVPDYSKTIVMMPVHREMKPITQDCLARFTVNRPCKTGYVRGVSMVSYARNILARQFLDGQWERAIWIDDDMVFTTEDIDRLVAAQEDGDYDVLAGVYMERTGTGFCFTPFGVRDEVTNIDFDGSSVPVAGVGFGLTVTTRRAFERAMAQDFAPVRNYSDQGHGFFAQFDLEEDNGQLTHLGEDFSFCWRVQAGGGKVGIQTGVYPLHVSEVPMGYWHWHAHRQMQKPPLEGENMAHVPLINKHTRQPFRGKLD